MCNVSPAVDYTSAEARRRTVLVAVMNNADDLHRAAADGWYRIPQRRAPRRVGADYLAFYQTNAFRGAVEAQTISYYAATRRYRLARRAELLPDEGDHARADEYYFCIDIGPLQRLSSPVPSAGYHRITFIHTTLDRLLNARDVRDLAYRVDPFETLWTSLREHGLRPLGNRIVDGLPVDITLRTRGGYLGIRCTDRIRALESSLAPLPARWDLLYLSLSDIERDLGGCLRRIATSLIHLGGSDLTAS